MKLARLISREIRFRWVNFTLSLAAVSVAVAILVIYLTVGEAYRKETRRIQLGMGQNLRIIPRGTRMDQFWLRGHSEHTMPEEYVYRFATVGGYEFTHLTATLQKSLEWKDREVILTGILPEVMPPGRNQPPIMFSVNPGEAYIGSEVAGLLGLQNGEEFDLFGKRLKTVRVLSPTGSSDDVRIYGELHDIQAILGLEGRINEIRALECLCLIETGQTDLDPLTLARQQLGQILPEGKVILLKGIADVRERQRAAMEDFLGLVLPLGLLASGTWIGILAALNVRARREEIGILRAVGFGTGKIGALFLGKALLLGVTGALIGFGLGMILSSHWIPEIFELTGQSNPPALIWLAWALILAPVFTVVCSFIPTMSAASLDPARILS